MKTTRLKDLINCPVCNSKAVLRRNASKDFQVACTKCQMRTAWKRKTESVITWYNMVIQYWKNEGKLRKE